MKVYVDTKNRCHTNNHDNSYKEVETDFFDGKCQTFIEGYCCEDRGGYHVIYPWKPHSKLEDAQREYERPMLAEYEAALAEIEAALGV